MWETLGHAMIRRVHSSFSQARLQKHLRLAVRAVGTNQGEEVKRSMRVITVPVLGNSKNYAYLLADGHGRAAAVDPAEPDLILKAAEKEGLQIDAILTTHKHWDHAGGNDEMQRKLGGEISIYGGINDNCQGANTIVKDGDEFDYHDIHIRAIETPFHTMGHICYYCTTSGSEPLVFTGDTLFVGGCGRFFEGSPSDAYGALAKLSSLPDETKVWCGHNYTASNLKFALHADPENKVLQEKSRWTKQQDDNGQYTVPTTIGEEKQFNPFLRTASKAMQSFTKQTDPVKVLGALRASKDNF